MEVEIVKGVQSISNNFFDIVFWIITKFGEEIAFVFGVLGIYLLYSKSFAFKYSIIYLISVGINFIVKILVKRPRPYIASSEIENRLPASNYSFPSGHSQGYFVQSTLICLEISKVSKSKLKNITSLIVFLIFGLLVMLSRLYWGQHYLTDVVVGAVFGICIAIIIQEFLKILPVNFKNKFSDKILYSFLLIVSCVVFIVFFLLDIFAGIVEDKVYMLTAVFIAMSLGYFIDKRWIHYNEKQDLKTLLIRAIILYSILIVNFIFTKLIFSVNGIFIFIIYFLVSCICTILLPFIFEKIKKVGGVSGKGHN